MQLDSVPAVNLEAQLRFSGSGRSIFLNFFNFNCSSGCLCSSRPFTSVKKADEIEIQEKDLRLEERPVEFAHK